MHRSLTDLKHKRNSVGKMDLKIQNIAEIGTLIKYRMRSYSRKNKIRMQK